MTTHSSHIVSQCDFKDIVYFLRKNDNIISKNFKDDLSLKYENEKDLLLFIQQYLTIHSSELLFAEKVIFIEGTTERILLPYFMRKFDDLYGNDELGRILTKNISIIEAGANAKAFKHLLEFLEIKTLIITDLDSTIKKTSNKGTITYNSCPVSDIENTSNATIKYYLLAPEIGSDGFPDWIRSLIDGNIHTDTELVKVSYQIKENNYHARSFEDAFISVNYTNLVNNKTYIDGLKNRDKNLNILSEENNEIDYYSLTENILDKKSSFASSLLFLALTDDDNRNRVEWNTPKYINEALEWIRK
ncbi:hypothetical protein B4903_23100 [Yersinia frederiksenii]|nr:hypothetical protein B4903_23100 [Yersinia frederiksenii]